MEKRITLHWNRKADFKGWSKLIKTDLNVMTESTNNYNQLIEFAVLDAHGLLEAIEVDLFNRSFHDAPAAIQDEIISLQEALALDDSLLPDVKVPESLKQKVIARVSKVADKEASRLAPLALIGARAGASRNQDARYQPSQVWRMVAMVLLGVAVVLAVLAVDAQRRASNMATIALNAETNESLAELAGPGFTSFVGNPYCHVFRLEREEGRSEGYIRVAIHELTGEGYVIGIDLHESEEIIILGTTPDGNVIELARLIGDSPVIGREFKISPTIGRTITISAVDANTGARWI